MTPTPDVQVFRYTETIITGNEIQDWEARVVTHKEWRSYAVTLNGDCVYRGQMKGGHGHETVTFRHSPDIRLPASILNKIKRL